MGLLARINAQGGGPMDPDLREALFQPSDALVAQAAAFMAKLPPALRPELAALLHAVDEFTYERTCKVYDLEAAAVLPRFGLDVETFWGAIEALDPPVRLPA
jgi:hypothetical protein